MLLISWSTCSELWCRFRTCDFRLDLSCVFYLCKFTFIVHVKCSFPSFCMYYLVKFTEVKQARWVKPEVMCSWIHLHHNSIQTKGRLVQMVDQNGSKFWKFSKTIGSGRHGGLMVSALDSESEQSGNEPWPGTLCCVLGQDTSLPQCLSPPRCINGYRQT